MQRPFPRFCVAAVALTALAATSPASASAATSCTAVDYAVTPLQSGVFYIDVESAYLGSYVGYSVTNQTGAPASNLWVRLTPTRNLLVRFDRDREQVLRFAHDFRVPFDNNLAERDIRMIKLQQKISGCWRTITGAQHFLALRAYLSTARKNQHPTVDALTGLAAGTPWLPAT